MFTVVFCGGGGIRDADRAKKLRDDTGIQVMHVDACDQVALHDLFVKHNFTHVFHLAAQAGVRYSLEHPLVSFCLKLCDAYALTVLIAVAL